MKRQRIVVSVACAGTLLVGAYLGACGGDDNVAVVGNDGGGDATTDGSSFDSSVRDTGAADTGAADTGTDAGSVLLSDAGTFSDAAPGGDAAVLSCGGAACNLPAQECCLYDHAGEFSGGCANGAGGCPPPADAGPDAGTELVSLGCEVVDNCPGTGKVCCITFDSVSGTISSQCANFGACTTAGNQHRAELCDPSSGDAGCGDAGACSNGNIDTWDLPSGFATCGGVASQ